MYPVEIFIPFRTFCQQHGIVIQVNWIYRHMPHTTRSPHKIHGIIKEFSRLNTLLSNNNTYGNNFLLIDAAPSEYSLGALYNKLSDCATVQSIHEIHSLKPGKCIQWFCLIMIMSVNLLPFTGIISFGHKKCHTAIKLVSREGVDILENAGMILLLPLTQPVVRKFGSNLTHVQIAFKLLWT